MDFETLCIHSEPRIEDPTGAVVDPLYLTSTFAHPGMGQSTGYDYARCGSPNTEAVERVICALEGGNAAVAFSSGMAAISTLFELFKPGDRVVVGWDLYGGTIRLFNEVSRKNRIDIVSVDTSDLEAVEQALESGAAALFVETPTNPTMVVSDIAALADLAHGKDALLIVDNTFLTPYFQKPIPLGADVVVHSGTKYLGGHHDLLAGILVSARPQISERLRFLAATMGNTLGAFDSWLLQRGLKTLPLRMERHAQNAQTIAEWLRLQPHVEYVSYPGLPDHPGYELSCRQSSGFSGMITFGMDTAENAWRLLTSVEIIIFAESLGGTESLITYPLTQTHADVPPDELAARGIDDRLLRLSVGLESADDLIADLEQAMA